jgi:hypothetical protein
MLPFPREHGAWGMLLIPVVVTAAALGAWPARMWLLLLCATAVFLARTALEVLLGMEEKRRRPEAHDWRWAAMGLAIYGGAAAATAAPLLPHFGLERGAALAGAGGLLSAVYFGLLRHYGRKTLGGEFFGVAVLTLTAPAAAYLIAYDTTLALRFWAINYLFFVSGLLYVKVKLEARKRNLPVNTLAERLEHGWPVLVYHVLLAAFVAAMVYGRWMPGLAVVAFAPVVARAFWGVLRWERRLSLPRLGVSELVHSLAFAALLGAAFHL